MPKRSLSLFAACDCLGLTWIAARSEEPGRRLENWSDRLKIHHGNFADVEEIAERRFFQNCVGVLFDLGVSSAQLDTPERGFSFRFDAKLDMRFDSGSELTAYDIVNRWPQSKLEHVISAFGGEPRARRVARAIVNNRRIETTAELADVVTRSLNWPVRSRNHPATRTFQALRMAVNEEIHKLGARAFRSSQHARQRRETRCHQLPLR